MERKRSSSSEEDSYDVTKGKKKFTEVGSVVKANSKDTFFDEPLGDEYQPQFFNYQLLGDLVAVAILNSKELTIKKTYYEPVEPFTHVRFCNEVWSVQDLLAEMKTMKSHYPVGKQVLLSVGYNDYRENSMNADMLIECLEKTIKKLRRRGCKEIILTNVPPCGMQCDSINHWKYLQVINDEIYKLCHKHEYIGYCDIFKLFCRPKNLFSANKDYVSGAEINYKIDFTMYNEVERNGEIDLIRFSNLAKIVLGKHMAKIVEQRVAYLRHGKVDKVICVCDVDDSDEEAMVSRADNVGKGAVMCVSIDSSDEDAGANFQDDSNIQNGVPEENVPSRQEIADVIQKPDDIQAERPSCEMPPEDQQLKQAFSSGMENVDDTEIEELSREMPPDQQVEQVTSNSISVGNIKIKDTSGETLQDQQMPVSSNIESVDIKSEKVPCEVPPEEERTEQIISCSIEGVGEEPSCQTLPKISCSIRKVGETEDAKLSCEMPQNSGKLKQDDFDESERRRREIVRKIEVPVPVKQESSVERSEKIKQELVNPVEKSVPVEQEIVSSVERSDDTRIKNKKLLLEIPKRDERFKQVILCNFKEPGPGIGKPSCEISKAGSQSKPVIVSIPKKLVDIKDEKPCEIPKKDLPLGQVILCSIRKVDVKEGKPQ